MNKPGTCGYPAFETCAASAKRQIAMPGFALRPTRKVLVMRWSASLRVPIALLAVILACAAAAQDNGRPPLLTNEAYIAEVTRAQTLAIDDPMAVFAYVLDSLPERVQVYPTENHYYFAFLLNGIRYAGNIKIDARLRSEGKVAFAYYEDRAAWLKDAPGQELVIGASNGVSVEKIDTFAYRVRHREKSVVFALNDLSQVKPPPGSLSPDEQFIGPVFDESAVRFFLVFNVRLKLFHYILDETTQPADIFVAAPVGDGRILLGKRTGFALYRDQRHDRKILIGVYVDNVTANNYLDGPFDQMPDNFIVGDMLRDALLAIAPEFKGKIDRYGTFNDGGRFAIQPYMSYRNPTDLAVFDRCASSARVPKESYAACFSLPLDGDHGPKARPLAMQRHR